MHHHDVGKANDAGDRLHLLHEIEGQLVVKRGVDRVRRRDQQQRVAVRRGAQHGLGGDIGAAARPVLDHEGLPELFRQPLPHQARREVRRAARRIADDEANRPRWIGLRARVSRCERKRSRTGCELQKLTTLKFLHASSRRTGGSCGRLGARILSVQRREADRYSQAGGGRFTASLRLAEERLIGEPDALLERGAGAPAELGQPADVEQLARRAVRAARCRN